VAVKRRSRRLESVSMKLKCLSGSLLMLGLAALAAGCGTAAPVAETIGRFAVAVQQRDWDTLYCLSAGAASATELGADPATRRSGFADWARSQEQAYLEGRDDGGVALDGSAIVPIKLFSLGRGTFYELSEPRETSAGAWTARMRLRLAYAHIDLSRFSPGTTLYFAGSPAGRIEAVRVPAGRQEMTFDALNELELDWTLVQGAAGECPAGWQVVSVDVVGGSERAESYTWVF